MSKVEGARFTPTNLGLAIIVSYSRMGLELGKPYLRAAMEQECVAVAAGTKSRQDVVRDCIKEVLDAGCIRCDCCPPHPSPSDSLAVPRRRATV